ncbi:hypothetical protein F4604DRAFT_1950298, partial [Suillus subluteus]
MKERKDAALLASKNGENVDDWLAQLDDDRAYLISFLGVDNKANPLSSYFLLVAKYLFLVVLYSIGNSASTHPQLVEFHSTSNFFAITIFWTDNSCFFGSRNTIVMRNMFYLPSQITLLLVPATFSSFTAMIPRSPNVVC